MAGALDHIEQRRNATTCPGLALFVGKTDMILAHGRDVLEIAAELTTGPVVFVGHSVSAMIGLLAGIAEPERFRAQVMIGPSPCYINDGDYVGGFSRTDIESLLDTLDSNYLGWASAMAPKIMGAPDKPELGEELTNSFCRTDPEIAKHFARVTFLSEPRTSSVRKSTSSGCPRTSHDRSRRPSTTRSRVATGASRSSTSGPTGPVSTSKRACVGLGLYIVRQIAVSHGGRVTVHSTAEDGTTFHVSLPRDPPSRGLLRRVPTSATAE